MRLGVIADIHGNILALEAVLADIARRGVDQIIDLGDCASGPLWPRETMERLTELDLPTVRGNGDREMAELPREKMGPSEGFGHDETTTEQRQWLGALPVRRDVAEGIVAFHATPTSDEQYLAEDIQNGRLIRGNPSRIAERLGNLKAALILCGHSHQAGVLRLPDGRTILNPGSVGSPAYGDAVHVSESGSPHARYAIVETKPGGFGFEMILLPYDHEAAAQRAEANSRPDLAYGLRTGLMPSR